MSFKRQRATDKQRGRHQLLLLLGTRRRRTARGARGDTGTQKPREATNHETGTLKQAAGNMLAPTRAIREPQDPLSIGIPCNVYGTGADAVRPVP